MVCEICGEGNTSVKQESEYGLVYKYLVCDSCGSEYADAHILRENKEWMIKLKYYTFSGEGQ